MTEYEQQVHITKHRHGPEHTVYFLTTEGGELLSSYERSTGWYHIMGLDVVLESRRRGIAKTLLRQSLEHARKLDASEIVAGIITRECVDAMRSVFGTDNVIVSKLGDYADAQGVTAEDDGANAYLDMKLR